VIASPTLAREPGFALSVTATAALLVVVPPLADRLRRRGVPAGVAEAIAIPVAAQAATTPVVVAIGGQVGLVAIPANLVAMPAVPPATVLGVLAALAAPVSAELAGVFAFLAGVPTRWLIEVGRSAARMPGAVVGWPGGLLGGAVLAAAIVVLALLVRVAGRRLALAAAAGALLAFVPTQVLRPGWPPPGWIAVACDVGQGDALVIRAGAGAAVVVDSGPDPVAVDGCLRRLRIARVPLVVLSHLHADHIGGLAGVLRGRAVGAIQVGILREPVSAWRQVEQAARARGLPVLPARVGELRRVEGVAIEVVAPSVAFRGTRSDPNNSSVIVRVRARGHSLLLGGDAEVEAQQAIERAGTDLRADVLKVPHHGSAYQDPSFLTAVNASVAVVSVGMGNDYGHPSPGVLAHLARTGARTFRTDRDGDIAVCDDGGRLTVATRGRAPPP
jgi:competence protein ComEC